MVECANVRRSFGSYRTPLGIDNYIVRVHANLGQHGTEQRRFVFAVAVAMREDVGRGVGLEASNAQTDGYVADVALQELSQGLHFVEGRGSCSCEACDLLLDLW